MFSIFQTGKGQTGEGECGLGGRGSTAKKTIGMDGWKGSDGVADMLERRQSFSGTLPQSRETKKERGSREDRETWQGFPSFVCLAQGCSARGNQEMSRRGGGGGEWGQALPLLRKRRGKNYFQSTEASASERAMEIKKNKQNKQFSFFERYSALEPSDPTKFRTQSVV